MSDDDEVWTEAFLAYRYGKDGNALMDILYNYEEDVYSKEEALKLIQEL